MRMDPVSEPVALRERETMAVAVREDLPSEQMASINRRSIRTVWNAVVGWCTGGPLGWGGGLTGTVLLHATIISPAY